MLKTIEAVVTQNTLVLLMFGGIIRYLIITSDFGTIIQNRVEVATPLNSFKRVKEGVYLFQNGIDPYEGDMVHETPLVLMALVRVFDFIPDLLPLLYILTDLLTAFILYKLGQKFIKMKLEKQKLEKDGYAAGTELIQHQPSDIDVISRGVLYAYLFNPLLILNCVGLTSTVFSNLLLALTLYFLTTGALFPCLIVLAFESMRNLYPVVLIAPIVLVFARRSIVAAVALITLFVCLCGGVAWFNFLVLQSWSYLDGTLGFIFFYRDLQPNIGLFWYFFTEMFEHFRTMFLITFQMNATVLYLLPLSFKLRKEPMLLATVFIMLMAIFRSYPCIGDVGFYLALLPLWKRCWKFMAHNFVVFGFFLVTLCLLPALWHLWIYAGSANANFYFGVTLAFSTGQIFLVTDLLFANVKREFCLLHGEKIYIDGKEAKIVLE